jgi:Flp pilus assembly protein TadG
MTRLIRLAKSDCASAAAEMALVLPFLLVLLFGSVELGNYFMDEHVLVKGVRDAARYAARQNFSDYTGCSGAPTDPVPANAQLVAQKGTLDSTAADLLPNWASASFTVSVSCVPSANGQDMLGIYRSRFGGTCDGATANGCAQVVTVSASLPYRSVLGSFGFSGFGKTLNASSQAAVTGI